MKWYLSKRFAIMFLIAGALALGSGGVVLLSDDPTLEESEHPEYATETLVSEPLPAEGEIEPDAFGVGTATVDVSNANRVEREDIAPLVRGLDRAGYDTTFHRADDLEAALNDTDVFIVIDPGDAYERHEVEALESFVDDGGRLLILGEPNRIEIAVGPTGAAQPVAVRSELTELEATFDLHFDTRYVYDMESNDGNFKHVTASPNHDLGFEDIDDVTLYTPTEVRSTGSGEPLLVTSEQARTAGSDEQREHTLAVVDGNVVAVGDATFLTQDRYNVGDNDAFVADLVDYLVAGEGFEQNGAT